MSDRFSLLTEPRRSLIESVLLSRINVEQRNDNNQHQAFHEEKEARNEDVVFVMRIRVGDKRSQGQSRRQPDELSFGVPHGSVDSSQETVVSRNTSADYCVLSTDSCLLL